MRSQVGEARLSVEVATVGVDVLPEQRDLADALAHEPLALGDDALEHAALLAAAHVRDDAVGAEVVAADHDGHPCVEGLRAMARQVGREPAALLDGVDRDRGPVAGDRVLEQARQLGQGARAEHDVDVGDVLAQGLAVALGDAAAHGQDPPAGGRGRKAHEVRGLAVQVGVGLLPHRARHEHDDVGLLGPHHLDAAAVVQKARHALGVVEVHLAAEGPHMVGLADETIETRHYDIISEESSVLVASVGGVRRCT